MGRRKSRYSKITADIKQSSFADLRKEFPAKLVKLFVEVHDTDYEDEKVYNKYKKEVAAFLGKKAEDVIEQGKLTVRLVKATFDLVKKETKNVKKEKKEIKSCQSKELPCVERNPKKRGSDEGPEEGSEQESVPK